METCCYHHTELTSLQCDTDTGSSSITGFKNFADL